MSGGITTLCKLITLRPLTQSRETAEHCKKGRPVCVAEMLLQRKKTGDIIRVPAGVAHSTTLLFISGSALVDAKLSPS
jgi:hypothetical protein